MARARRRSENSWSWALFQQPSDWLAPISASPTNFVCQFTFGPRRLTARIPLVEKLQCISIGQCEAADEATANAEGVQVAMLSGNCGRESRQVSAGTFDSIRDSPHTQVRRC